VQTPVQQSLVSEHAAPLPAQQIPLLLQLKPVQQSALVSQRPPELPQPQLPLAQFCEQQSWPLVQTPPTGTQQLVRQTAPGQQSDAVVHDSRRLWQHTP
jgi:hypothetical protein